MQPTIRSAVVLLAGVVAAVIGVVLTDALVAAIYPLPAGTNMDDKESLAAAIAAVPVAALVLLVSGWAVAAGLGSYLAARLAIRARRTHGLIVTLFVLVATISNLASIPHPTWMWPAAIILIPAVGWAATRLVAEATPGSRFAEA